MEPVPVDLVACRPRHVVEPGHQYSCHAKVGDAKRQRVLGVSRIGLLGGNLYWTGHMGHAATPESSELRRPRMRFPRGTAAASLTGRGRFPDLIAFNACPSNSRTSASPSATSTRRSTSSPTSG